MRVYRSRPIGSAFLRLQFLAGLSFALGVFGTPRSLAVSNGVPPKEAVFDCSQFLRGEKHSPYGELLQSDSRFERVDGPFVLRQSLCGVTSYLNVLAKLMHDNKAQLLGDPGALMNLLVEEIGPQVNVSAERLRDYGLWAIELLDLIDLHARDFNLPLRGRLLGVQSRFMENSDGVWAAESPWKVTDLSIKDLMLSAMPGAAVILEYQVYDPGVQLDAINPRQYLLGRDGFRGGHFVIVSGYSLVQTRDGQGLRMTFRDPEVPAERTATVRAVSPEKFGFDTVQLFFDDMQRLRPINIVTNAIVLNRL